MEWISTSISVFRTGQSLLIANEVEKLEDFFFCFKQIQGSIGKKYEDHFISMDIDQTACCVFLKL